MVSKHGCGTEDIAREVADLLRQSGTGRHQPGNQLNTLEQITICVGTEGESRAINRLLLCID